MSIPPYISKKMMILEIDETPDGINVDYVNELSEDEKEKIAYSLDKSLILKNKITEEEFFEKFKLTYSDVSVDTPKPPKKRKATKKTVVSSNEIDNEDETIDFHELIQKISTEDLVKEVRRRSLETDAKGRLIINNNGEINYSLHEINWPTGAYEVTIHVDEDITEKYIKEQKKAQDSKTKEKSDG